MTPHTLHKLIKMRMIFSRCATASSAPSCHCSTSLSARAVDDCLTIRFHFLPFFHFHFPTAELLFLQGFVKARLAMFDKPTPKPSRKLVSGSRHFQEIINNNNLISIRNNKSILSRFPDPPKRAENFQAAEGSRRRKEEERSDDKSRVSENAPTNPRA